MDNDISCWSLETELLLAEWSEKASCFRWLYSRSEKKYKYRYYLFSIPVIILSTLTGAANVGMDSFVNDTNRSMVSAAVGGVNIFAGILSTLQTFLKVCENMENHRSAGISWSKLGRNISIELAIDPNRSMVSAAVGGVNIFAGILSTLQNFLQVAELMESHRSASVSWSKLGRNISIELALDKTKHRAKCNDFLAICRAEYDRLIEQSPMIDDDIISQFKKKFKKYKVSKPSICNGLDKCIIHSNNKAIPLETELSIPDYIEGSLNLSSDGESP